MKLNPLKGSPLTTEIDPYNFRPHATPLQKIKPNTELCNQHQKTQELPNKKIKLLFSNIHSKFQKKKDLTK